MVVRLLQELDDLVSIANFMLPTDVFSTTIFSGNEDCSIKVYKGERTIFQVDLDGDFVHCQELGISYHSGSDKGWQAFLYDVEQTLALSVYEDFKRKYKHLPRQPVDS